MTLPQLTNNIENKLLSLIEMAESNAHKEARLLKATLYLQLADLYHFHKEFLQEVSILERYARLNCNVASELVDIYERIDRVSHLNKQANILPVTRSKLELVRDEADDDEIIINLRKEVKQRVNQDKKPFSEQCIRVLTMCAAYTGRNDEDEIVQLALVLSEYIPSREKPGKILDTFWGKRNSRTPIPAKTANLFSINQSKSEVVDFDAEKIILLFKQAAFVVSHNDADIERKLLATVIPQIVDTPWYSSQKDIPWGAIGFDSNSLTHLAVAHHEKPPRTCMDRAMVIHKIMQSKEPYSSQVYLERLYNMQPMRKLEWTPSLIKQQKRLAGGFNNKIIWIFVGLAVVLASGVLSYYLAVG